MKSSIFVIEKLIMNVIAFVLLLCSTWLNVGAYKILSVFPIPGKSHFLMGNALMEGLAEAGHEVTVIAPFQAKNSYKNYKSVVFDPSVLEFRKSKTTFNLFYNKSKKKFNNSKKFFFRGCKKQFHGV